MDDKEKVFWFLAQALLVKIGELPTVFRPKSAAQIDAGHQAFARGDLHQALSHYKEAEKLARKNSCQRADAQRCQAEVLLLMGNAGEAQRKCYESKLLYKSPRHNIGLGHAQRVQSELHMLRNEWEQASASLEKAQELCGVDKRVQAGILRCQGQVHVFKGDMLKAEVAFNVAKRLYEELGDRCGLADIAREMAKMLQQEGKRDDALSMLNESLRQADLAGNKLSRAEALRMLGEAYLRVGELDTAAAHCKQAEQLYYECGTLATRCKTLRLSARIHAARGAWTGAIRLYREADLVYLQMKDHIGRAWNLRLLGDAMMSNGDWQESEIVYIDALRVFTEADNRGGMASANLAIGYLELKRGNLGEAHKKLRKGAEDLREEDHLGIANAMLFRGELDCEVGEWDSAAMRYDTALSKFIKLKDKPRQLLTILQQVRLFMAQGRVSEAEAKLDQAKIVQDDLDAPYLQAEMLLCEGELRLKQNRCDVADALLYSAATQFEKLPELLSRADAWCALAEVLRLRNPLQARSKLEAAQRVYLRLGVGRKAERVREKLNELSTPEVTMS